MSSSPTQPLASRDINTSSPSPSSPTKLRSDPLSNRDSMQKESVVNNNNNNNNKPKSMDYHRQVLQNRLDEDKAQQTYVSPSDTIMSPCTAKLSAYKSKQFGKAKPQSLFAKMEASRTAAAEAGKTTSEGKDGVPP